MQRGCNMLDAPCWGRRGTAIEIQVLGTVQAVDGDRLVDLGGPRQRRLLAALVLGDGRPVSTDALVEAVFGADASPRAADTLRSYVTRLRRALSGSPGPASPQPSSGDVVVRDGAGYRLRLDGLAVDAERFAAAMGAARRHLQHGDPEAAVGSAQGALSQWGGASYGDRPDEAGVTAEAQRLDEARALIHKSEPTRPKRATRIRA